MFAILMCLTYFLAHAVYSTLFTTANTWSRPSETLLCSHASVECVYVELLCFSCGRRTSDRWRRSLVWRNSSPSETSGYDSSRRNCMRLTRATTAWARASVEEATILNLVHQYCNTYVKQHWKLNPVCHYVKPRCNRGYCVVKHCCHSERCAMEGIAWGVSSIQAVMWMAGAIQGVVWNTVMIHGVVKIQRVVWPVRFRTFWNVPMQFYNGAIHTAVVCFGSWNQAEFKRGLLVSYRGQCRYVVRNFTDRTLRLCSHSTCVCCIWRVKTDEISYLFFLGRL